MNSETIWNLVKPLIKKRYKAPNFTDINLYEQYYKAAAFIGIIRDERYPRVTWSARGLVEEQQFQDKDMWQQGNKQSLTYRSNRLEENLNRILRTFRNSLRCNYLWEVKDGSWNSIGYVVATDESGAQQIAKMMYMAQCKGETPEVRGGRTPIWKGDQSPFIRAMNDKIQEHRKSINRSKQQIENYEQNIENSLNQIEFLTLNMMAFSSEQN
tara:strand:- start:74151 stop:74786 length:636 start_codon:yes stop_codon:yes gene_type:complete